MLIWIIINNRCLFVTNISCYQFYQIFYRFLLCKYLGNDKNCLYTFDVKKQKKNNSALWTINCQFQIKRNIRKRMKKTKNRYFEFALHCKRPDLIRATIFVRIACQTPRCYNVIYDGVCLEISLYNLLAVTTLQVPPKELGESKMRKQLLVQIARIDFDGYIFAIYEPAWVSYRRKRLGDFRPWDIAREFNLTAFSTSMVTALQ